MYDFKRSSQRKFLFFYVLSCLLLYLVEKLRNFDAKLIQHRNETEQDHKVLCGGIWAHLYMFVYFCHYDSISLIY